MDGNQEIWNDLTSLFEQDAEASWLEKVREDLKGRDLSTLQWVSPSGVIVKPFYTAGDRERPVVSDVHGECKWHIVERIPVHDATYANRTALELLENGAESIVFNMQYQALTAASVNVLLKGIYTDMAPVAFTCYMSLEAPEGLPEGVTLLDDRLLHELRSNDSMTSAAFRETWHSELIPGSDGVRRFTIDAAPFKDAGADHVQELAYTLALAHEYFQLMQTEGPLEVRIRMATAGNFFFEIAKLRAFRKLWRVFSSYHSDRDIPVYLEATSAHINKSFLDSHTNMLRNTAECMAAALGGADGINVAGHLPGIDNKDNRRWASNISRLLRYESYFDSAPDAAAGSYFVESLTDELADKAWNAFKLIESDGGFIASWKSGVIEAAIQERLEERRHAVAHRKAVLIGVNDYPDPDGRVVWPEDDSGHPSSMRLEPARLAEPFEGIRRRTADHTGAGGNLPDIALVRTGKPAIAAARVNYASNFMACAGWDSKEYDLDQMAGLSADIVILCSDDDSWPEALDTVRAAYKGRFWLAGNPAGLREESRQLIDGAVYNGCNILETLQHLQNELLV